MPGNACWPLSLSTHQFVSATPCLPCLLSAKLFIAHLWLPGCECCPLFFLDAVSWLLSLLLCYLCSTACECHLCLSCFLPVNLSQPVSACQGVSVTPVCPVCCLLASLLPRCCFSGCEYHPHLSCSLPANLSCLVSACQDVSASPHSSCSILADLSYCFYLPVYECHPSVIPFTVCWPVAYQDWVLPPFILFFACWSLTNSLSSPACKCLPHLSLIFLLLTSLTLARMWVTPLSCSLSANSLALPWLTSM